MIGFLELNVIYYFKMIRSHVVKLKQASLLVILQAFSLKFDDYYLVHNFFSAILKLSENDAYIFTVMIMSYDQYMILTELY